MNNIILDTHILLWSFLSPNEISKEVTEAISGAQDDSRLFISSITLWEIAMLVNKKRINLFEPTLTFLNSISQAKGLNIVSISTSIAADSGNLLNFHGDPADRIITATTRELAGHLITKDEKILTWAKEGYMKTING
ncbi:MAG: type II toxin-antitoxin system VapC family toxin [Janthinobacterium lividum]